MKHAQGHDGEDQELVFSDIAAVGLGAWGSVVGLYIIFIIL